MSQGDGDRDEAVLFSSKKVKKDKFSDLRSILTGRASDRNSGSKYSALKELILKDDKPLHKS